VPEPTLYLFDGYNLLHAGTFSDRRELIDLLASFVAVRGARGVVVFDGVGEEATFGALEVRFAPHADALIERIAAERRSVERVFLVSSDAAVRGTAGQEVGKLSSRTFLRELDTPQHREQRPSRLEDRLDAETRARLERLRRGE
jgi:predicted RNA-binding protein with PIN domain